MKGHMHMTIPSSPSCKSHHVACCSLAECSSTPDHFSEPLRINSFVADASFAGSSRSHETRIFCLKTSSVAEELLPEVWGQGNLLEDFTYLATVVVQSNRSAMTTRIARWGIVRRVVISPPCRICRRSLNTASRPAIRVGSSSSMIEMRGKSCGLASEGTIPRNRREVKIAAIPLPSANLSEPRRSSKYLEVFFNVSSRTRYRTLLFELFVCLTTMPPRDDASWLNTNFDDDLRFSNVTSKRVSPVALISTRLYKSPFIYILDVSGSDEDFSVHLGTVFRMRNDPVSIFSSWEVHLSRLVSGCSGCQVADKFKDPECAVCPIRIGWCIYL